MSTSTPSGIGILGSGRVAAALASKLSLAGHTVTIGTRKAAEAADWQGPPVAFAGPAEAARHASVVINATPGDSALERLGALSDELHGKILIDVSNATVRGQDGMPGGLSYPGSSLAELLQYALPGTHVVKTLNTMFFTVMTDPGSLRTPPTAFLSGDDARSKTVVTGLLADLGWPPAWIEDLGGISTARGPEALMLLVPSLIRNRGLTPFALTVAV
ncbi:NAD(P)-binding domain-containing protein [Streptomyces sp. NPDC020766]|uniref:NADPH-dependent F420 reductase n=1 Tax=Streptomyces sp. NPDC020766 TaxID=3155011 RepID=UPI0034003F1D